jgi:hypothetical protein
MAGLNNFFTLSQYALNTLYCLIILVEYERVFSGIKGLITPNRNILAEDIIEVYKYLKVW